MSDDFTPITPFDSMIRTQGCVSRLCHDSHRGRRNTHPNGHRINIVAVKINEGGYAARFKTNDGSCLSPVSLTEIPPKIKQMINLR